MFVDAGYLFSAGSDVLHGRVHPRSNLVLEAPDEFLQHLADVARACCDTEELRILRTYWYDGAPNGIPAPEQVAMGERSRLKLRLGRLTGGGQKGVDGLIILDLINLASNRAVDTAVLLSGDEDLREAVLHAQGYGVSVVLLGLPPTGRQGQSELLVREADHHMLLDPDRLAQHVKLRLPGAAATRTGGDPDVSVVADQTDAAIVRLVQEIVDDSRFSDRADLLDADRPGRLTRPADRLLVARLAELTGQFPVDPRILRSARALCADAGARR